MLHTAFTIRCLLLLLSLLPLYAEAQFVISNKKWAEKIKSSTLAVVQKQPSEKDLKFFKKRPAEELAHYKAEIEMFNQNLRKVVEREWKISKEVVYISEEEAEKLKKENNSGYFILASSMPKNYAMDTKAPAMPSQATTTPKTFGNQPQPLNQPQHRSFVGRSEALELVWAPKPRMPLTIVRMPEAEQSQGVLTYLLQQIINQLEDGLQSDITSISAVRADIKKRAPGLKDKIVLISEEWSSENLLEAARSKKLGKEYPFAYQVVSKEQLSEYILSKDPAYAYAIPVPAGVESGGLLFNYHIIDVKDGHMMYWTGKSQGPTSQICEGHLVDAAKLTGR